jgi:hypothetical protein
MVGKWNGKKGAVSELLGTMSTLDLGMARIVAGML